jgi:LacI family transcriptional regulator
MPKQKATLKIIAKELDVSVSTVSKALRDSKEIGKDTKEKVKAFAKLYNYRPNNIALSLKNKKTKTLGVIIPEIVHHFFTTVISGIESYANSQGYNVIVGLSNESFNREVINLDTLANGSIDGFIMSVAKETLSKKDYYHLSETIDQGIPIVMFDRVIDEIGCDKVIVDDVEAAKKAVFRLLDGGCKTIALVTTKDYVNVGKLRTQGYTEALTERGITINEDLIFKLEDKSVSLDNFDNLEGQLESYLGKAGNVDGIFAVNEIYALTAMKAVRKMGKNIPDDIQVIGFTDGVLSKHAYPPLTTVDQNGYEIGKISARLLIERLEIEEDEEENYKTVIVDTKIIERETTFNLK